MFRRVLTEEWTHLLPFIGFFLFFGVFLLITFCALRLCRPSIQRLAALPLDAADDRESHPSPTPPSP
jgi:hypothetical protein